MLSRPWLLGSPRSDAMVRVVDEIAGGAQIEQLPRGSLDGLHRAVRQPGKEGRFCTQCVGVYGEVGGAGLSDRQGPSKLSRNMLPLAEALGR